MKKRQIINAVILCIIFTFVWLHIITTQNFIKSTNPNIFNLRGPNIASTINLIELPDGEKVLITQAHLLKAFTEEAQLTWQKFYGFSSKLWFERDGAFEVSFSPKVLWKDDQLDAILLEAPTELLDKCKCTGLKTDSFHTGKISLTGYPRTSLRTYPLNGEYTKWIDRIFGTVEQKKSLGKTWVEGHEYVSDVDALPGSTGSLALDEDERVIAILNTIKSSEANGYRRKIPAVSITPIEQIIENYQNSKKN